MQCSSSLRTTPSKFLVAAARTSSLCSLVAVLILFSTLLTLSHASSYGEDQRGSEGANHRSSEVVAASGVVATDDRRCSRIGMNILREGGNAVDAAVGAALCLGVVSPASSGIGGGAFMLIRQANGEAQAFDMRETAPMRASKDMYAGNATLKSSGPLSIGVPGELAGLHKAWEQHGRLSWKRLVRPAERLARRGFKISPYLHMQMLKTQSGILADEGLRHIFASDGTLLQPGDTCYNKKLADTLRKISKYGVKAFYNGSIAHNLVGDVQKHGGILTVEDLRRYQVKIREPISSKVLGYKILGMPPPSSGGTSMILTLNILTQYGVQGISGPIGIHRLIEALKHALAVRMNLGDPDFLNVSGVVSDMLSPTFAEELRKTIDDNMTFDPGHYGGRWNQITDHGTSHVSIVDMDRNAVSMTNTVNGYFGAQILSPSTGILLNNEMDDFSMPTNSTGNVPPPAPPNFVSPGKRPLSSMSPTIVLKDEQLKAVVGASGGGMIIAGTTQVFLNYFAKGLDPLSSVLAARVYHQLIPNVVQYEDWTTVYNDHFELPADVREFLQQRGHILQGLAGGTICQFVVQDLETSKGNNSIMFLRGVSDPRKGGLPAGY
ncbi:gamma-glutamyltransferase [Turnera subulata]|uniref:Glutathione hydrolase n=1 Tax=Turnera subulata TaxID=218843 RepID=A0A9Q0G2S3_9ROSI|nr:gamma-glutamyltransferase [Turnera subulata]